MVPGKVYISSDKQGIITLELLIKLKLRYETAGTMSHIIRKAMQNRDSEYNLSGVIEIDETIKTDGLNEYRSPNSEWYKLERIMIFWSVMKAYFTKMCTYHDWKHNSPDKCYYSWNRHKTTPVIS
jgi:hypothetical protein